MIRKAEQKGWKDVRAEAMNSENLTFSNDTFTHSFASFVLMVVSDPDKVASEMYRTLKPGGTAFETIWETFGWPYVVHAAQKVVKPDTPLFCGLVAPEWQAEVKLRSCLETGWFRMEDVEIKRSTVTAHMKGYG
jgi:ubiquinone/menaquinone biosynthesis C-methylase UbiE